MARIQQSGISPNFVPTTHNRGKRREAYLKGWRHGHGIACHNVPSIGDRIDRSVDWVGLGARVDSENLTQYHAALCYAAAETSRCQNSHGSFAPLDFIAHEFNTSRNTEALWDAFEAGEVDSIAADLRGYGYEI